MLTHPSSKYACFQRGRIAENICVAGDTVHITVYFIRTNVLLQCIKLLFDSRRKAHKG